MGGTGPRVREDQEVGVGSTRKKKRIIGDPQHVDPMRLDGINGFVALSVLTSPTPPKRPKAKDGPPCHMCSARCCKYFALPIDKPKSKADYEYVRWYLMHEGIAVWVDDGDWYLEVRTVCKHLQADYRCGIYETRPNVCREYGMPEDGPCEYFTDDLEYDLYFDNDETFAAWAQERLEKKRRKKLKRKKAA